MFPIFDPVFQSGKVGMSARDLAKWTHAAHLFCLRKIKKKRLGCSEVAASPRLLQRAAIVLVRCIGCVFISHPLGVYAVVSDGFHSGPPRILSPGA